MNTNDTKPELQEHCEAGLIIASDGGALWLCAYCRSRIAISNQFNCTACRPL